MSFLKNLELLKSWIFESRMFDGAQLQPHPAIQIFLWFCLVLILQTINGVGLSLLAAGFVLLAVKIGLTRLLYMLRRTRWILVSVFMVYSFTSPGDLLWAELGVLSPVTQGVTAGLTQIFRLLAVLASLSALLAKLSQTQLLTGLYSLFRPMSLFGLPRERIAVRLALTLRYADSALQNTKENWQSSLEFFLKPVPVEQEFIEIKKIPYSRLDLLLLVIMMIILAGVWI